MSASSASVAGGASGGGSAAAAAAAATGAVSTPLASAPAVTEYMCACGGRYDVAKTSEGNHRLGRTVNGTFVTGCLELDHNILEIPNREQLFQELDGLVVKISELSAPRGKKCLFRHASGGQTPAEWVYRNVVNKTKVNFLKAGEMYDNKQKVGALLQGAPSSSLVELLRRDDLPWCQIHYVIHLLRRHYEQARLMIDRLAIAPLSVLLR